jgi:signal transduction histidine kinase
MDVCALMQELADDLAPLAQQAGSSLELDLPAMGAAEFWDPLVVERMLENLILNAIKYGDGRPITVSLRYYETDAVIKVRDEGAGISLEDQDRIFELFERAATPGETTMGWGIGLWLVHKLADAMDGSIKVLSAPHEGSTFTLTLPHRLPKETP